ncbi:hypothetical protein N9F93_00020 [bacterium]|nr:hypothetical protein [bacterium]
MATVLFTSNNYSSGSCVFTPSDPNLVQRELGSITFPYTFDPLQHYLPQDAIEGTFVFTTSGCVFTKTVTRPATSATTQATSATAATTQATSGSGSGGGSGGGSGETLATAATTLATAATTQATAATTQATNATNATFPPTTLATVATTVAPLPRYEILDDNTDGGAEIGEVFQFRVATTNVREGVSVGFNYVEGDLGNSFRRVEEGGEPFEGEPQFIRIGPDGVGILHLEVLKAAGNIQIRLEPTDTDGNTTRDLQHLVKLLEPAATAATTQATAATEATTLATSATAATTQATAATTLATNATAATTQATSGSGSGSGGGSGETLATAATTLATNATAATTQATSGSGSGSGGGSGETLATAATTLATNATAAPTNATEATTQATSGSGSGSGGGETEATAATTLATNATNATAAPTNATEATTQATSGSGSGSGGGETLATAATTLATNATEATTQATNATEATTQAIPENNYLFTRCSELASEGPEQIILSGGEWEIYYGELPVTGDTMEHRDTMDCYDFTSGTPDGPNADIREYTRNLCVCEGKPGEPGGGERLP